MHSHLSCLVLLLVLCTWNLDTQLSMNVSKLLLPFHSALVVERLPRRIGIPQTHTMTLQNLRAHCGRIQPLEGGFLPFRFPRELLIGSTLLQ